MTADLPTRRARPPAETPLDEVLLFLDLVYESAERPARLADALAALGTLVGARSAQLLCEQAREKRQLAAAHLATSPEIANAPLHPALRTIPLGGGLELVVEGSIEPGQETLLLRLAPHFARALRLAEARERGERDARDAGARLERLSLAVALLDAAGEVVFVNRAARALLAESDAVALRAHRLAARGAGPGAELDVLVECVTGSTSGLAGGRVRVERSGAPPVEVVVSRFPARIASGEVRAVALLSSAGVSPTPEARLRDLFGLSESEARAAVDIVAGKGGVDGAEGPSALVGALYRKLGSTRQADLLRLLLRPPGAVFD